MSKYLDYEGLQYYTGKFKPGLQEVVNGNIKNELKITNSPTLSLITLNSDQTITITGTVISNISYTIGTFSGIVGTKYHISGCPVGGSSSTWRLALSGVDYDYGNGLDYISDGTTRDIIIFVKSGQTVDITFKPMICTESMWNLSYDYVPYAMSNYELTNNVATNLEIDNIWNGT